jgi:hypothetical protein
MSHWGGGRQVCLCVREGVCVCRHVSRKGAFPFCCGLFSQ